MPALNLSQPPALVYEVLGDCLVALEERVLATDKQRGVVWHVCPTVGYNFAYSGIAVCNMEDGA